VVQVVTSVSAPAADRTERGVARILELPPIYAAARIEAISPELHRYFNFISSGINSANARSLENVIHEFQPDVAYLWNLLGLGGLGVLALLDHRGVPWVWHLMDLIPLQLCGVGTAGPELARELSQVFPGRYIVCSSHVLGEIRDGGAEIGERVDIIPNWVHGDPPPVRTEFFSDGVLRILTASGTVCEAKGTHILIESAALLRQRGFANFTIDIYGNEAEPQFRALLHTHDVADTVRLMGPRTHDDLLALYGTYDVFAFPTWSREPSAFAPLEAAASGCVPLFTNDCGNAEWMIDGVDCLKARRDSDHFADRIAAILGGSIDLRAIGRRAQAVAWREFHISRAASKVETILAAAAAEDRRPVRRDPGEFFSLARFAEGIIQAVMEEAGV
jgi:glycosyltransferase involved in cell wall biosynthesis